MSDIFYVYGGSAYANLTNKCPCSCTFCIRNNGDSVGDATTLWHSEDPSLEEIMNELADFPLADFDELVFCGYGEPTCAIDNLEAVAEHVKKNYNIKTRLNTNGLGNLVNKKDILPQIAHCIDSVSISLNAPDSAKYDEICDPEFDGAFDEMLRFAESCRGVIPEVTLTVVDIISPEDIELCREIAESRGITFRVRTKE